MFASEFSFLILSARSHYYMVERAEAGWDWSRIISACNALNDPHAGQCSQ